MPRLSPSCLVLSPMSADTAIVEAIEQLKRERNAVVLAHYYQEPEIPVSYTHLTLPTRLSV